VWPHFDRDGDKISDLMEVMNFGRHDWNYFNPTIPDLYVLSFSNIRDGDTGSLVGGVVLPEEGIGYRHFYGLDPYPNSDNWGTLRMLQIIEAVGREWTLSHTEGPRISIGDISLQDGDSMWWWEDGQKKWHDTHQRGLDADVRYVRSGGSEANYTFPNAGYSQALTMELLELFCKAGIDKILVDAQAQVHQDPDPPGCSIDTYAGHINHFHIHTDWP
jgi:murein endopeptidase